MRATLLAAALAGSLATVLVPAPPAAAQLEPARPDALMDRLSMELFAGYVPGTTDWMWVDMDWWFPTQSRHQLEATYSGAPISGAGVRYELTSLVRLAGTFAYTPRDDRAVRLNSAPSVSFGQNGNDFFEWETDGGGTLLGRLALEVSPYRGRSLSVWVGGGPGFLRTTASADEDVPSGFAETWSVPTAFLTGRVEVPVVDRIGVVLAADHHWTWWDDEDLARGVEEFFDSQGFTNPDGTPLEDPVAAEGQGLVARMWLVRLGLSYDLN